MIRQSPSLCSAALGIAIVLSISAHAQQQETPAPKQVTIEGVGTMEVTTVKASVEAVDQENRLVKLKGPRGNVITVPVSDRVKNLPQVKAGDLVEVAFFEAVAINAEKTDAPPTRTETVMSDSAPPGEKPAGVAFRKVQAVVNVLSVDTETQSALVRGPRGRDAEVKIRDPKLFSSLKAGDKLDLTYIEGVAIEVRPAEKTE